MGLPTLKFNVVDNGLGQANAANGEIEYVIGGASVGPFYQLIQSTNPNDFLAAGMGPGVELAGFITNSTGNEVAFVPVPLTGGANTALTAGSSNTSPLPSLSGTPQDSYYCNCQVVTGGTVASGSAQVSISLDAGRTTFVTLNVPSNGILVIQNSGLALTTGLTLTFTGTLVSGDQWWWVSTEGVWSDASIQSAINCMLPIPSLLPEDLIVAGGSAQRNGAGTVGCTSADVTAFDGYMTTLFNKRRFNRLLCSAGDILWGGASTESEATWMTSLQTAHASDSSSRVGVTAGHYNAISPFSQCQFRRPLLWQAAARDSLVAIQVDIGAGNYGPLPNTPNSPPSKPDTGFANSLYPFVYHDEYVNPGLDAARFTTAMSRTPLPGLFISNPNLMAAPGSDFNWLQHGHVTDAACQITLAFFLTELSDGVRVGTNGRILPQDAADLQTRCNQQLADGLVSPGAVSSAQCIVSLTDNILQTATLTVQIQIQPLGYLKTISVSLTYVNVAATTVQQQQA
jgi:hypothetical protein